MIDSNALQSLFTSQHMQRALHEATWAARILLHVDTSIIFLINPQNKYFKPIAWHGREPADLPIPDSGLSVGALRNGRRSITWDRSDRCSDPDILAVLQASDLRSGMMVPILAGDTIKQTLPDQLIALWLVASTKERSFVESDELILETLAQNIGLTSESMLLSIENVRYRREADALNEINKEISQLMDLDKVLEGIAKATCYLLNAEISYIALVDEKDQSIKVRTTEGTRGEELKRMVLKFGEGVGGLVASSRKPILVDSYPSFPRPKPPGVEDIAASESIESIISVPMQTRQGLVGVLFAASRRQAVFNHSQLDLLSALGTQAAIAIHNANLYRTEKITTEKLRTSIDTSEKMLNLVLNNQGLQSIADALSDLICNPVVVIDGRFRQLIWSAHGCAKDQAETVQFLISSVGPYASIDMRHYLEPLRSAQHALELPADADRHVPYSVVAAPIVAGETMLGHVLAVQMLGKLNELQRSTVEQASIVFALEFLKQEAAEAVEQRLAGDFLDDLLTGRGSRDPGLMQRAARFSIDLHRPHRILVLDIDDFAGAIRSHRWTDMEALNIKRRFFSTVSDIFHNKLPGSLISVRSDDVIALVPAENSETELTNLLSGTQYVLKTTLADVSVSVGVGRMVDNPVDMMRSYTDAQIALAAVQSTGSHGRIVIYEKLGVVPLLLQSQDQQGLELFMQRYLKTLAEYDTQHQTQLVDTLETFLANNGNLQRTANTCHVHLNSLKYRLNRIEEISGLNLDDGETRFNLQLAISIRSALNILKDEHITEN